MLFFQDSTILGVAVHTIGNKLRDEFYVLSDSLLSFDEADYPHLMNFFCRPFHKIDQVNNLYDPQGRHFNEVYFHTDFFFAGDSGLLEASHLIAKHLYEVSEHPKINGGEFYMVHFKNVIFEGEEFEAIGLFKSDHKEMYAKVTTDNSLNVAMEFTQAINTCNIDKAALILAKDPDDGYTVLIPEIKNAVDSQYWKDDFLRVIARNDNNLKTSNFMKAYRSFVTEKMEQSFEFEKADQAALLNDGLKYLKEHETLNCEEFAEEVLKDERAIALFHDHLFDVSEETELLIPESFDISSKAVKKAQSSYKSVIKLDKNFHIYIHGNRDRLSRPEYDEEKGMSYYKVYFEKEG